MRHRGTTFPVILKNRNRPLRLLNHTADARQHCVYVAPLFISATTSVHLAAGARTKSISPRFWIDRPKFSFFSTVVHVLLEKVFEVNDFSFILGWMTFIRMPLMLENMIRIFVKIFYAIVSDSTSFWSRYSLCSTFNFDLKKLQLLHLPLRSKVTLQTVKQSSTLNNYLKILFLNFLNTHQWLFLMNSIRVFKQWWMIYQVR